MRLRRGFKAGPKNIQLKVPYMECGRHLTKPEMTDKPSLVSLFYGTLANQQKQSKLISKLKLSHYKVNFAGRKLKVISLPTRKFRFFCIISKNIFITFQSLIVTLVFTQNSFLFVCLFAFSLCKDIFKTLLPQMLATGNAKIQVSMSAYLSLTAFVEIESKWFGFGIKDATAGLKLEGGLDLSCDISVDGELRFVRPFLLYIAVLYPIHTARNPPNKCFSS